MSVDHLADVGIQDLLAGVRRLESIVASWGTFPPRRTTIQDAQNLLEGLQRTIAQMRDESRNVL